MTSSETAQRIGRVGAWVGALGWTPAAPARAAVAEVEKLGYRALWFSEAPTGKEALSHAGLLLAAGDRITVATGIANIWARDATAMNAAANVLAEAYPERFVLGMGISHAAQVDLRGHEYRRPVTTMRAYLDAMDAAPYEGPRPTRPAPRILAALRPRMLELAAERAAGAHSFLSPPEHTAIARGILGDQSILAPQQAVLLNTDPTVARRLARGYLRFYLALSNYVEHLRTLGFTDEDFGDGGSDRLVDTLVAWGDIDAIRARVAAHFDAGADHVAIQPIAEGRVVDLGQLTELAPALLT